MKNLLRKRLKMFHSDNNYGILYADSIIFTVIKE